MKRVRLKVPSLRRSVRGFSFLKVVADDRQVSAVENIRYDMEHAEVVRQAAARRLFSIGALLYLNVVG